MRASREWLRAAAHRRRASMSEIGLVPLKPGKRGGTRHSQSVPGFGAPSGQEMMTLLNGRLVLRSHVSECLPVSIIHLRLFRAGKERAREGSRTGEALIGRHGRCPPNRMSRKGGRKAEEGLRQSAIGLGDNGLVGHWPAAPLPRLLLAKPNVANIRIEKENAAFLEG